MNHPIRKTITWTIIQTVLYNPLNNQCEEYKRLEVPLELNNEESRDYVKENCSESNIIVANVRHETRYHEISFEDFLRLSKEITRKEYKYYYKKKK